MCVLKVIYFSWCTDFCSAGFVSYLAWVIPYISHNKSEDLDVLHPSVGCNVCREIDCKKRPKGDTAHCLQMQHVWSYIAFCSIEAASRVENAIFVRLSTVSSPYSEGLTMKPDISCWCFRLLKYSLSSNNLWLASTCFRRTEFSYSVKRAHKCFIYLFIRRCGKRGWEGLN